MKNSNLLSSIDSWLTEIKAIWQEANDKNLDVTLRVTTYGLDNTMAAKHHHAIGELIRAPAVRTAFQVAENRCIAAKVTESELFATCRELLIDTVWPQDVIASRLKKSPRRTRGEAIKDLEEAEKLASRLKILLRSLQNSRLAPTISDCAVALAKSKKIPDFFVPSNINWEDLLSADAAESIELAISKKIEDLKEQQNKIRLTKGKQEDALFAGLNLSKTTLKLHKTYRGKLTPDFDLVLALLTTRYENPPDITSLRKRWSAYNHALADPSLVAKEI